MKRFILWVTMLLFSQTQMIGSCVISEIQDPSKKVRFLKKSGKYFLLSKKLEKWVLNISNISQMLPTIDNRIHYSFMPDFKMDLIFAKHSSYECKKRKLLILIKIQLLVVVFLTNY